jgi:hypothetical protein
MKNAKVALVIAAKPKTMDLYADGMNWQHFLCDLHELQKTHQAFQRFHENVWQIEMETELDLLSDLLHWGKRHKIPIRVLFLEETPAWIENQPKPAKAAAAKKP